MKEVKIKLKDDKDKDIDCITNEVIKKINNILEKENFLIDALIVKLPVYRVTLNENLLESTFGNIDIFTTNSINTEDFKNDNITIIVKEREIYQVALDGPSASGKSTIAKLLSGILGINYLDTGSMYRAITYYLIKNNINLKDEEAIKESLKNIEINCYNEDVKINGVLVTDKLRTDSINKNVSLVASYPSVRKKLVAIQQKVAEEDSSILDGRDIGTTVLPNAKYKFFIIATAEERAKRRLTDVNSKSKYSYDEILEDIKRRDYLDSTRKVSPLKKADDAIEIDSTNMSIDKVVENILNSIRGIV